MPRSWAPSKEEATQTGLKQVQHESGLAGRDGDNQRHGDDQVDQPLRGVERSIRLGTAVPPTVLVTNMGDGSLFLKTWRDGPRVYLSPADAVPLRRVLSHHLPTRDSSADRDGAAGGWLADH